MSPEKLNETSSISSIRDCSSRNLVLEHDSPLLHVLQGVFLICQYREGNLEGIWFLDEDSMWKEATSLGKFLSIAKLISEKQSTTIAHIATYPPKTLQYIEKQMKGNQHSFILSLLHKTESEVNISNNLLYLLALLEFPSLKIERQEHSLPTAEEANLAITKEAQFSVTKKVPTNFLASKKFFTDSSAVASVSPKTTVSKAIPIMPDSVRAILTKTTEATEISTKPTQTYESEFKPTATKTVPPTLENGTTSVVNTEINGGASEEAEDLVRNDSTPNLEASSQLDLKSPQKLDDKKGSAAFLQKEKTLSKEVTVTRIEWNLNSQYRQLTATIFFKDDQLGDKDYSKITGRNIDYLEKNGIGKGAKIRISQSKDEIQPKIEEVTYAVAPEKSPNLPGCKRKGSKIQCDKETIEAVEESIETFLDGLMVSEPSLISEAIVEDLGIISVSQLLFDIFEEGAEERFKRVIKSNGLSGEEVYEEILAAVKDSRLDWVDLVQASGVFLKNIKETELVYELFETGITINDLIKMRNGGKDLTRLLKAIGFNQNDIKLLMKDTGVFEKWWDENGSYFRPGLIPQPLQSRNVKGMKIDLISRNKVGMVFLKLFGIVVTNQNDADLLITDNDEEKIELQRELQIGGEIDKNVISWDEFLEDYLR